MSQNITFNGTAYTIPNQGDSYDGDVLEAFFYDISTGTLQPTGGTFTLSADVDFGPNYGLKSSYFSTRTANPASAGLIRLANTDGVEWRNAANSADLALLPNASDLLAFNGVELVTISATQTLTNKTLTSPTITAPTFSGGQTGLGFTSLDDVVLTTPATNDVLVFNGTDWVNQASGVIAGITAGAGLTGGGTSGTINLDVGAGSGISVAADTVAVDSTVIRTTGAQTLAGVTTFTSGVVFGTGQTLTDSNEIPLLNDAALSFTGTMAWGGGSAITSSSNVALLNTSNTLTGSLQLTASGASAAGATLHLDAADPWLRITETDQVLDAKVWYVGSSASTFEIGLGSDASTALATAAISIARSTTTVGTITLGSDVAVSGGLTVGGTAAVLASRLVSAGTGMTGGGALSADVTLSLDTTSNYNVDHSLVTITAGSGLTGGGDITASRTIAVGAGTGISVNTADVALDTASTLNTDHSLVSITAGNGLTGGGTIAATRTLTVGAGTGITVGTSSVGLDTASTRNTDHASVSITAGTGLTGGGTIAATRSLAVDTSYVATLGTAQTISGVKTFSAQPLYSAAGAFVHHGSSSLTSGVITVSASAPSGGADGDIWFQT